MLTKKKRIAIENQLENETSSDNYSENEYSSSQTVILQGLTNDFSIVFPVVMLLAPKDYEILALFVYICNYYGFSPMRCDFSRFIFNSSEWVWDDVICKCKRKGLVETIGENKKNKRYQFIKNEGMQKYIDIITNELNAVTQTRNFINNFFDNMLVEKLKNNNYSRDKFIYNNIFLFKQIPLHWAVLFHAIYIDIYFIDMALTQVNYSNVLLPHGLIGKPWKAHSDLSFDDCMEKLESLKLMEKSGRSRGAPYVLTKEYGKPLTEYISGLPDNTLKANLESALAKVFVSPFFQEQRSNFFQRLAESTNATPTIENRSEVDSYMYVQTNNFLLPRKPFV